MSLTKNAVCGWDFTLGKSFVDDEVILIDNIRKVAKHYCFKLEMGEGGYIHYQGRLSLKVKSRHPDIGFRECNWSPTSCKNVDNNFYIEKEETSIGEIISDKTYSYIPKQIRGIVLHPWQKAIVDDRLVWNTRTINCVYCKTGNIGKSILTSYVGCHKLGRALPMMDSYKDLMRMVMDTPKSQLYLVDFPRSLSKVACAGFWSAIETIKNGYAYDDRYSFREEYFDSPNIWVFLNTLPDLSVLSTDRWRFWVVDNLMLIPRNVETLEG